MSEINLILDDYTDERYRIRYVFPDDEFDTGAALGESRVDATQEPQVIASNDESLENWETWIAEKLAAESGAERDMHGWFWEKPAAAKKVLAAIRKRIKAGPGVKPDVTISHETATIALEALENLAWDRADVTKAIAELKKVIK